MHKGNDGLIKLHLDLPKHWWKSGEAIWAKALGDDQYEIQNVPFCAYGLNFGDVVVATQDGPDLKPEIRRVVRASGHRTLRLFFSEAVERERQAQALDRLVRIGVEIERADDRLVGLDLPPGVDYQAVRTELDTQEAEGLLAYETCEARIEGSFDDRPTDG